MARIRGSDIVDSSVTGSDIQDGTIVKADLENMAAGTVIGRAAGGGAGVPSDLSGTQVTAILDNVVGDTGSGGTKGLVPAPGAGDAAAGKFLKADGTFAVPAGTGISQLTSDVTAGPGSGSQVATIASNAVTFAKMQDIATDSIIGRDTAGSGDPESITLGASLEFSGSGTIQRAALTGDVTASANSNSTTIAANAVTNAKSAQMAAHTFKGNNTGATADAIDLTKTELTAELNQFTSALQGVVPGSGGGTANFLRADGTWSAPGGSASPLTTKGDLYGFSTLDARVPIGSNGQVLTADSSAALGLAWKAAAAGGINMISLDSSFLANKQTNSDAEVSVGDWLAYADAAATTPVDMTGGAPNTTIARNTTSPLNGSADFKITVTTGASRQGEGVAVVVNIPPAYRGKALTLSVPYATTGTIAAGDFVPYGFDVTNSTLLAPTVISGISGSAGNLVCTFVPASTCASLRIGIHIARTSTGAATINFDDVQLKSEISQANLPMSDWVQYTPTFTGLGTVSVSNVQWRRVGDSVEILGRWTNGTPTAVEARISLPNGVVSDSSKISALTKVGSFSKADAVSAGNGGQWEVYAEPGLGYVTFGLFNPNFNGLTKQNGSSIFSTGIVNSFQAIVPISGWSSGGGTSPILSLSDWVAYTPTGSFTTNVTYTGFYRRIGDSAQVQVKLAFTGATDATSLTVNMPTGLSIDSSRLVTGVDNITMLPGASGSANDDSGNVQYYVTPVYNNSATAVRLLASVTDGPRDVFTNVTQSDPFTIATGDTITVSFMAPISGWTSVSSGTLTAPRSEITVDSGNGHGSTATKIRRFTNTRKNIGSAITYADSSIDGGTFTINEQGIYSISYMDANSTSAGERIGITVNDTATTTNMGAPLTYAQGARAADVTEAAATVANASWTGNLNIGDVVRGHTNGGADVTNASCMFTITKVSN